MYIYHNLKVNLICNYLIISCVYYLPDHPSVLNWQELKKDPLESLEVVWFVVLVHLILVKKIFFIFQFVLSFFCQYFLFTTFLGPILLFCADPFSPLARNDNNEKTFFYPCIFYVNCCLCFYICVCVHKSQHKMNTIEISEIGGKMTESHSWTIFPIGILTEAHLKTSRQNKRVLKHQHQLRSHQQQETWMNKTI